MEYLCLEEDEIYETQCGDIFLTTKGRLVFHCTLCEKKFNGPYFYEAHVKDHIPITYESDHKKSTPTHPSESNDNYEYFNHQESNFVEFTSNDSELDENISIKIENSADEIGSANKGLISEKKEKYAFKTECKNTDGKNHDEITEPTSHLIKISKLVTHKRASNEETILPEQTFSTEETKIFNKTQTRNRYSLQLENEIAEYKKKFVKPAFTQHSKSIPDTLFEMPKVIRAVKSRYSQRSLLTPDEERKHKCPVCGAAFKDRHNMIHHLKRHSDNKDHKCPECDKSFFTTSEVNVHLKSHKGERPFLCNICGKSFAYNNQMLTHFKRHTNQKQHKCETCGKAFFDSYLLKNHMISHGTERPFSCTICLANFSRRRTLINHVKLHQNKREYKCELCDSRFNQQAGLVSHMKTAHKDAKIR